MINRTDLPGAILFPSIKCKEVWVEVAAEDTDVGAGTTTASTATTAVATTTSAGADTSNSGEVSDSSNVVASTTDVAATTAVPNVPSADNAGMCKKMENHISYSFS